MAKITPKASFVRLVEYWNSKVTEKELKEAGVIDHYFAGMQYFAEFFGKIDKEPLFDDDIELMLLLRGDVHYTTEELAEKSGQSVVHLNRKMHKLVLKGYVSAYVEKRVRYYCLTLFGDRELRNIILNKRLTYE